MIILGEFAQAVQILNPGEPTAVDGRADIWQSSAGEFDDEGTLQSNWTAVFPPGTLLKPLAEVLDVASDRWFWIAGQPETRASLLTGYPDHIEAPLRQVFRQLLVVDVLRDAVTTDTDEFGDPIEGSDVHLAAVDAAITEMTQKVPVDGDLRTVRVMVGWLPAELDVRTGDRIRVPAGTGPGRVIYGVEAVTQPIRTGLLDLRLDLTRSS